MFELYADDVVDIREYFKELKDPRSTINQKHLLEDLIVICVLAVIAGADGPNAIGIWANSHRDWLIRHLPLPGGIPSHDTIGRLLAALQPHAFQSCFENWIAAIKSEVVETTPDEPVEREIIAVDGKTLRRSHDHRNNLGPLHLVSAWSVQFGISLGQLATDAKSNEIRAIPVLIDQISVKKAIVTIDAVGCQKEIARNIIDSRGHYVLALKGNQEKLHSAVESYIVQHMENDFAEVEVERHVEEEKGHGRRDTLSYYQLEAPKDLPGYEQWEKLRTIGIAIRNSETKTKSTNEVRYYISSLDMDGRQFARAVRGHWRIENSLHWSLDVTFREDENRTRNRHAADNLAWLKRFAISLLKQQKDKESVAMRRRMAGWNVDYLAKVLGIIG